MEKAALDSALTADGAAAIAGIQDVLDRRVPLGVHINPEMRVKVAAGPAADAATGPQVPAPG